MVFVSSVSNAIITLNSYSVKMDLDRRLSSLFFCANLDYLAWQNHKACPPSAGDTFDRAGMEIDLQGCRCIVRDLEPRSVTHLLLHLRR